MNLQEIIIAIVGLFAGGGIWSVIGKKIDKSKSPYEMVLELLENEKRFYNERNAEYEREKLDSAEKSVVIGEASKCPHRFKDPSISCPVEKANQRRLNVRCDRCNIYEEKEENDG